MWVTVGNVDYAKLSDDTPTGEKTSEIKKRVKMARAIQDRRFLNNLKDSKRKIKTNSDMNVKELGIFAPLPPDVKKLLSEREERESVCARERECV